MKIFTRLSLYIGIIGILSIGIWYFFLQTPSTKAKSTANLTQTNLSETPKIKGCDISHWNGEIDWVSLKKTDIKFLFVKATQGNEYIDPSFNENWASAKNYGFHRGAYHFYQPHIDPELQAKHFLNTVKHEKGDIIPVLDIEISHGVDAKQLTQDILIWLKAVEKVIGRPPMIYTDRYFWDRSIDETFAHYPLWIAEWQSQHHPILPNHWTEWVFWQYSASGTVNGIATSDGKTDLNYFAGELQSFGNYLIR